MKKTIYTIGHSTHPIERFLNLLGRYEISALCDVRSSPYSRINPQFNHEILKKSLSEVGLAYVFLGDELGARSSDPRCYRNGKVQYSLLAETDLFRKGIGRLLEEFKRHKVALMCAEKEPLECHRTILISRQLIALGLDVQHIRADGTIESHGDALLRLIHQLKLPENDLFRSREEILFEAYCLQSERIAYSKDEHNVGAVRSSVG